MSKFKLQKGLIHYYYGDGVGKTTSTFGTMLRSIGHGLKPIVIQFLKKSIQNENINLEINQFKNLEVDISDLIEKFKSIINLDNELNLKMKNDKINSEYSIEQFSRKGFLYGDYITITELLKVPVIQLGTPEFILPNEKPSIKQKLMAQLGLELIERLLNSDSYDFIILDEIATAIQFNLIDKGKLIQILTNRFPTIEIFLTGREYIPELADIADYITEFKKIKHPFDKGILARKGIEF